MPTSRIAMEDDDDEIATEIPSDHLENPDSPDEHEAQEDGQDDILDWNFHDNLYRGLIQADLQKLINNGVPGKRSESYFQWNFQNASGNIIFVRSV